MGRQAPKTFGRYALLERIAVGGMAEVFRAKAVGVEGFERLVAIKRILPSLAADDEFVRMFVNEARIAAKLRHDAIVQIHELGRHESSYYIAMEHVLGLDLRALLDALKKRNVLVTEAIAAHVMTRIAEALEYVHGRKDSEGNSLGLIHRDISPQNILLSYEGDVKLCDFGIAKAAQRSSETQVGVVKGKFGYLSPEQVQGKTADHRSDLFAVGTVLWEMLAGQRLFAGTDDFSTLLRVRDARVPPLRSINPKVSADMDGIVRTLLARSPESRFQSAAALVEALQDLPAAQPPIRRSQLKDYLRQALGPQVDSEVSRLARLEEGDTRSGSKRSGSSASDENETVAFDELEVKPAGKASDFLAENQTIALDELGLEELVAKGPPLPNVVEPSPPKKAPRSEARGASAHPPKRSQAPQPSQASQGPSKPPADDSQDELRALRKQIIDRMSEDAPGKKKSGGALDRLDDALEELMRRPDAPSHAPRSSEGVIRVELKVDPRSSEVSPPDPIPLELPLPANRPSEPEPEPLVLPALDQADLSEPELELPANPLVDQDEGLTVGRFADPPVPVRAGSGKGSPASHRAGEPIVAAPAPLMPSKYVPTFVLDRKKPAEDDDDLPEGPRSAAVTTPEPRLHGLEISNDSGPTAASDEEHPSAIDTPTLVPSPRQDSVAVPTARLTPLALALFGAAFAVLVAGATLILWPHERVPNLEIDTQPRTHIRVTSGGIELAEGVPPILLYLGSGAHQVELEASGFEPTKISLTVAEGRVTNFVASLRPVTTSSVARTGQIPAAQSATAAK